MAKESIQSENSKAQMKKGVLEFCILLIIARDKVYASEILEGLKGANLIVVEGTLYPLLSRLKAAGLLQYSWVESQLGPPRKYYTLTPAGRETLRTLKENWQEFTQSIARLIHTYEKNT